MQIIPEPSVKPAESRAIDALVDDNIPATRKKGGPEAPETAEREADFRAGFKAGHSRGAWSMMNSTGWPIPKSENQAWNAHRQALEAALASASEEGQK